MLLQVNSFGKDQNMRINFSRRNFNDPYKKAPQGSLMHDIEKTRYALENAYAGFDEATDPDLIDCYIYEVNSLLKRYKYLMEQAAGQNPLPEEDAVCASADLDKKSPV